MHNPESILENETHKPLLDFEIQTDHLISTRGPDFATVKKRTCPVADFAVPAGHKMNIKEKRKER